MQATQDRKELYREIKDLKKEIRILENETKDGYTREPDWMADMFKYPRYMDKVDRLNECKKELIEKLKSMRKTKLKTRSL